MSPTGLDLRMTVLARTSSNCKQQTHPLIRQDYIRTITTSVQLEIKLLVMNPKRLVTKMNRMAVNHQP
jgi:hypothetical protein